MPNKIDYFVNKKIYKSVLILLINNKIPEGDPLEYYIDDILKKTFTNCARHFLKRNSLRKSEYKALTQLTKNINQNKDLLFIEHQLGKDLARIEPIWGIFLGTDRGEVYNTFTALKKWPCFDNRKRLYYKAHQQRRLLIQLHAQSTEISRQRQERKKTASLFNKQKVLIEKMNKQNTYQFITIKKLKMANKTTLSNQKFFNSVMSLD